MVKSAIYGAIAGNAGAAVATIAAPIFYGAVLPALKSAGILQELEAAKG